MVASASTPTPVKPDTTGQRQADAIFKSDQATDLPWVTIVWDDPVNLMTYVTYVFQKLFGYSEPHATKLMLQVHNEGKAVVSAGSRESMEVDVSKLHAAGLWATLQQDRWLVRKWKRVQTADGPRFRSALELHEAALLKNLVGSVVDMLDSRESSSPADELEEITGMKTGNTQPPDDPTLQRLLPDFYRTEDREPDSPVSADSLNAALRGLHEPEIIEAKRVAAQQLLDTVPERGGRFELTEQQANAWIAAVNDIRLALGTMLDIGPNGPDRLPADHPMAGQLDVYQWLTALQEYLVLALMGRR